MDEKRISKEAHAMPSICVKRRGWHRVASVDLDPKTERNHGQHRKQVAMNHRRKKLARLARRRQRA